jgi:hypothetical protein
VLEEAVTTEILIKNNLALLILALDSASIVAIGLESLEQELESLGQVSIVHLG